MTDSYDPTDFSDPTASFVRGFHGEAPPRDLSGVTLELATLTNRSALWTAHGVLPPKVFKELGALGEIEEPVELHLLANPVMQEGRQRVRVRGRCWGRIRLACVRCLTEFSLPLEGSIDAFYAAGKDPAMKSKRWLIEEDVVFLPDGMLKLRRLVEEELLLVLPMNPLCKESCAGLCAECGADLNTSACGCRAALPTGPFAVLGKLKKAGKESKVNKAQSV
ncbi:MAG: DUF177 domain-containing protein [Magnetococcales bacterium]|nr:DUF177 domain-containing protein [Magnetococcales bacterium]